MPDQGLRAVLRQSETKYRTLVEQVPGLIYTSPLDKSGNTFIHDEIGEILTGLKLILEISTRLPIEAVRDKLNQAQALVGDLMRHVEELSLDLRSAMLDDLELLPAIRRAMQTNRSQKLK